MNPNIEIRKATLNDVGGLFKLHRFWIHQKQLKINFELNQLQKIVLKSEVAVAVDDKKVVSYYFVNPFFEIGNLEERRKIIENKIAKGILPQGKYAYSLQSATDENYIGQGLSRAVLNLLRNLCKDKYDYFIGVMDYDNFATQKSSLKMGWKHLGDIGIGLLAVIGTGNCVI